VTAYRVKALRERRTILSVTSDSRFCTVTAAISPHLVLKKHVLEWVTRTLMGGPISIRYYSLVRHHFNQQEEIQPGRPTRATF
jgi:hypothetical protein